MVVWNNPMSFLIGLAASLLKFSQQQLRTSKNSRQNTDPDLLQDDATSHGTLNTPPKTLDVCYAC
jgi:hypothetical protein